MTFENLMLWMVSLMSCAALGFGAAKCAMRDQRRKGSSDTAVRRVGGLTGCLVGGFLILMTAALWVLLDDTGSRSRVAESVSGGHAVGKTVGGTLHGGADMGGEAFVERFDRVMARTGMAYRASGATMDEQGGEAVFRHRLGEDLMMMGRLAPGTGRLERLLFIGNEDAPQGIGSAVMTVAAATLLASHPTLEMAEALKMVASLVETFNRQGEVASLAHEGVTYTYQHRQPVGNIFTVNVEG